MTMTTSRDDLQRVWAHVEGNSLRDIDTPEKLIAAVRRVTDRFGDVGPRRPLDDVEVVAVDAGGVSAHWVIPAGASRSRWGVHLHGGGWMAGGFESHSRFVADIAVASGLAVLLPEYRLTPEHPYPAGLDDSIAVTRWAGENGPWGPDRPESVFLSGDSAGGNLAAATMCVLSAEGGFLPDRLVLISAIVDATVVEERTDRDTDPISTNAAIATVPQTYGAGDLDDPRVSPLRADDAVLAKFPHTLLQASAAELFSWDARQFASRLALAGARVSLHLYDDMPHIWPLFGENLPESLAAIEEFAQFVNTRRGEGIKNPRSAREGAGNLRAVRQTAE